MTLKTFFAKREIEHYGIRFNYFSFCQNVFNSIKKLSFHFHILAEMFSESSAADLLYVGKCSFTNSSDTNNLRSSHSRYDFWKYCLKKRKNYSFHLFSQCFLSCIKTIFQLLHVLMLWKNSSSLRAEWKDVTDIR